MRGHRAMEGSQGSGRVDNAVTGLMGLLALVLAFGACGWQGALARCAAILTAGLAPDRRYRIARIWGLP